MDKEILFTESQRFRQWWLWLILLGVNGLFFFLIYQQIVEGQAMGNSPMSDTGLLIVGALLLLMLALFASLRLDTVIKKDGIHVRFFPFHLGFKHHAWDTLHRAYIREYSAIWEYGGWGLRIGLYKRGAAYIVAGSMGLQLEFTSGKKLLIGTHQPEELGEALRRLGQLKP